jgi:hypothetical protein
MVKTIDIMDRIILKGIGEFIIDLKRWGDNMRDLINIVEDKECQTPGANYRFETTDDSVTSTVTLPFKLDLTAEQVKKLENELHDSLEQVFKQFF